jgi:DNA-binding response OmpR family regulator
VLFDVVMPGIGGDELCSRLRAAYGDDIVLIAVTGCSEGDPRVHRSFSLADHYFTKPIDPVALSKVLHPLG